MIRFVCGCGARLKAPPEKAGREVGCPTCLVRVVVPEPRPPVEVDLAEIDDEPVWPRASGPEDDDDGVPIRRWSRAGRARSGHPAFLLMAMCGAGFLIASIGSVRGHFAVRHGVDRFDLVPYHLACLTGSLLMFSSLAGGVLGWAYFGVGDRVRLYRVVTFLTLFVDSLYGVVFTVFHF